MNVITLTTDFGTKDWFVGTMKGVILRIHPEARLVDLTHEVPPGDVGAGAFALASAYAYFPAGSIHVAVIDPGVGGRRRAICAKTERFIFVGPDNGVLALALRQERVEAVRLIQNPDLLLPEQSCTFHGRDVFAPLAAHLSAGAGFDTVGPIVEDCVPLPWPDPTGTGTEVQGEVVYVDRFGNGITNISHQRMPEAPEVVVQLPTGGVCPLASHYDAVPRGQSLAILGSTGFLEIAVNGGSAREILSLTPGAKVRVMPMHAREATKAPDSNLGASQRN